MIDRRRFTVMMGLGASVPLGAAAVPGAKPSGGKVRFDQLHSSSVPGEVRISIYTPPGYGATAGRLYPLLLLLHGGNGSEQDLLRFAPTLDEAMIEARVPPFVVAMPSARRSLYMDYKDGSQRWETLIIAELLPHLRKSLQVSAERQGTFVGGWSMGGLGSLRLAFKHPDLFAAVAALEPAIEPALSWSEIGPHVRFWRPAELMQEMFGSPIDTTFWEDNNPATLAKRDPGRLLGLGIYLDVGDQDMLYLYEGTEFLHRILFDARLAHEYRLVHGADHVGPSLEPRIADAIGFIGRQIRSPDWIDPTVLKTRAGMDEQKRRIGMPVDAVDPRRIKG
ncbi:MAG TPA: alpha/beta hydrolase-fold protein [Steroidobacteraceae bacterium]